MNQKFFKIFKAGKYPQGTVTESDIAEIAQSYNRDYHEAPLTVNHEDKSPAYAVVSEVKADDKFLLASFDDILDEAYEVNKKFKKPSVEIAEYDGKKYLRAVTLTNFPQVKNLDKIQFSAEGGYASGVAEGSSIFFSEDLTINLNKGLKMFNEKIVKLAESLSLDVTQYQTEDDLLVKAAEVITSLKSEIENNSNKIKELEPIVNKFNEEGVTVEKFIEQKKLIETFQQKRVDDLIALAVANKKILPAQGEGYRKFAELNFDEASKLLNSLPGIPEPPKFKTFKDESKQHTYEEVLKDPKLLKLYSKEELEDLRKNSNTFGN